MSIAILLFIVIPTLELVLLIKLGSFIGALPTVAIVFLTAILGASLLRREGFSTLMKARSRMESGQMPAQELVEGALLVMSGAFLLTPGFITDSVGFACLIPTLRRRMAAALLKRMTLQMGSMAMYGSTSSTPGQNDNPRGKVFEGEVVKGEVVRSEVILAEVTKDEVTKDEVTKDEVTKDEVTKDEVTKGEVTKGEVTKGEVTKGEVTKDEVTKDEVTKDEVTKDEVTKDVVTKDEVTKDEVTKDEVTKDEVTKDERQRRE